MSAETSTNDSFKIMTYNINFEFGLVYGYAHIDALSAEETALGHRVLAAILAGDADAVFLQETNHGWERFFREHLGERYPLQRWVSPDDRGFVAAGMGVLVDTRRLSLLRCEEIPTSDSVRGSFFNQMVARLAPLGEGHLGRHVTVVNTHLRPPLGMGPEGTGALANLKAYFFTSPGIHVQEVQKCEAFLAQEMGGVGEEVEEAGEVGAVVYLGDFNESDRSGAVEYLIRRGFVDAARSRTTWHWPLFGPFRLSGAYDHILYNRPLTLVDCRILNEHHAASDHLPVVATFQFSS